MIFPSLCYEDALKKSGLASFYRPPNSNSETMDQFCYSVNKVFQDFAPNYPQVLIGGDFNLPGIDWTSYSVLSHKDVQLSTTLLIVSWKTASVRPSSTPRLVRIYST